jgi:LPS O-antigen subunit length determinant protein (WzzB/FepE family)
VKKKIINDEIDLFEILLSLWENKFKILIITTAFITTGLLYFNSLNKSFTATTNIKPISTFEDQKYEIYNTYVGEDVLNLNSQSLFNLFINQIQIDEIIEKGIIKSKLINKDNFKNEESYEEEVKRTAILIIDQMSHASKNNKTESAHNWQYNYNIIDKLKWRNFLEYVEENANEKIRQSLISEFNTNLEILSNNAKFIIEDIDQKIVNELENYENSISNRLAFLNEQAEIARALDISKNTLEIKNFETTNTIASNIEPESSYYLNGYVMIEKEISLINSRTNKEAFIKNLAKLKQARNLILKNKKINRLKFLFSKTPIYDENEFIAGKIDYLATTYKPNNQSLERILGFSLIIGLLISIMYVFVLNVITSRK